MNIKIKNPKNSITLNFIHQLVRDWRYWALLALFVLLIFLGTNIMPNDAADPSLKNLNSPEITSDNSIYQLAGILNSEPGRKYHLLFQIKVKNSNNSSKIPNESIQLGLTNNLGNTKNLTDYKVTINADSYIDEDLIFTTDDRYQNIFFQKDDSNSTSEIFIKNVHLVRLEGDNEVKPSFVGSFDDSQPIESFGIKAANNIITQLKDKDMLVGETFIANNDYLTSADLKLNFRGNGGNGEYQLVVREINNGKVSDKNLSIINFNSSKAEALYQSDLANGIYHFPVSAKLNPGGEYFIGISNQSVQTNFLNDLQVMGSSNSSINPNGETILIKNGKKYSESGDLYLKYYFSNQLSYAGQKVNFGDTFDDLGNGTGTYTYSNSNIHSDLDIFESGDEFVTYKINTFFPFRLLYLEAALSVGDLDGDYSLSYSFDNKNWIKINEDQEAATIGNFKKQIKGDGNQQIIYIKATGKTMDKTTFGLTSFNIHASVNINN